MGDRSHEFLQPLANARNILWDIESRLAGLAHSFKATGNSEMSKTILEFASDIKAAHEMVDEGSTAAFNRFIDDSNQASTNMLMAAFAVAEMKAGQP